MGAAMKADADLFFAYLDVRRHIDQIPEDLARLRVAVAAHPLRDQPIKAAGQHQQGHVKIHLQAHRRGERVDVKEAHRVGECIFDEHALSVTGHQRLGRSVPLIGQQDGRYFSRMSIAAQTVAEVMALPEQDRAYLARQLIASLDDTVDADAEAQWNEVIDRRSREMAEGRVDARPEADMIGDIQARLHARHPTS